MKKKDFVFKLSFLIGVFLFSSSIVNAISIWQNKTKPSYPEFASHRLIVKLKPEADKGVTLGKVQGKITTGLSELDKLNYKFKVEKQEKLFKDFKETALKSDKFSSIYVLEVPESTDLKQMKAEYESRVEVEYAEVDHVMELYTSPADSLCEYQWYLNNSAQEYLGIKRVPGDWNDMQVIKQGMVDADIDALEAFERGIETTLPLVGIIDTGVDTEHEDLADNIWTNPGEIPDNGIDDEHNGFVDDFHGWDFSGDEDTTMLREDNKPSDYFGHGTHVAGIVAAVRNNHIGVSGITSPCRIMAIKVFPYSFSSVCAKGIIYAADLGCDIINMSWGSTFPTKLIEDAIDYAIGKGVLPIAAAGNSGAEDCFYPASLPQVFTVGASNSKDEVTYFSTYGEHIEVLAPGEDILSLRAEKTDMYAEGGASGKEPKVHIVDDKYYLADGTSMASPCAVGVAAYILAASPGTSKERVIEIIQESADDIIYPYGGDSLYSPGKDIYSGYGRVNLNSALQLLSGRLAKIDYPYENDLVSGYVPIIGTASGDSFQNYVLEFGEGLSPENWIEIKNSDVKVQKDTLGIWNSSSLNGIYTLRLTVGDQNQAVVHVITGNAVNVKITLPKDGDTVKGYTQIHGYTIVPDFSYYTLEYGYGESPINWDTIVTSTKMVADHILGNWLVNYLEEAHYTLRLTVNTITGETHADSAVVAVRSINSGGWSVDLISSGSLSPAAGDIDGDGYDEIVIGVGGFSGSSKAGGVEVFTHQGMRKSGWPRNTDKNMMSSPALGDLDRDGIDDIVICSEKGVHAYLSKSSDWFKSAVTGGNEFWSLATPVMADLDNRDEYLEVLMINNQGTVYAWRYNGSPFIPGNNGVFARATESNRYEGFPSLAVADLDNDRINEVIAGSAHGFGEFGHYTGVGGIYIWDSTGTLVLGPEDYPDNKFSLIYGIAIANVDASEDLEIITFGQNEEHPTLCAFKKDGSQAFGYPIILEDLIAGWWWGNHPAVGDLDGDGILEIVVSIWTIGEARIYAWHQDGTPLSPGGPLVCINKPNGERKREVLSLFGNSIGEITNKIRDMSVEELGELISTYRDTVFASTAESFGSPILVDINQDGHVDIVCRAGYFLGAGYERVFAYDYEGNLIPGWPLYTSAKSSAFNYLPYTPLMADLDKDGKLNMIIAADWPNYKLTSWEFDTNYLTGAIHWPKYRHDKWNSSKFSIDLSPPEKLTIDILDGGSVRLEWKPAVLATSYDLYRMNSAPIDTLHLIASTSDTLAIDSSINILSPSERMVLFYGVKARYLEKESPLSELVGRLDQKLYSIESLGSFNLIPFPFYNDKVTDAKALTEGLPGNESVCVWNIFKQRFEEYDPDDPSTDFPVSPGHAYGSFQSSNDNWILAGNLFEGTHVLKTSNKCNFNLLTVPFGLPDSINASDLCEMIPLCNSIAFWDPKRQGFIQYVAELGFKNFALKPGQSYLISVSRDTVWNYSPVGDLCGNDEYINLKTEAEAKYVSSFILSENVHAPHLICGSFNGQIDSVSASLLRTPGFNVTSNSTGCAIKGNRWILQIGSPYYGWKKGDTALVQIFSDNSITNLQVILSWNLVDSIISDDNDQLVKIFRLSQNFPNPFNLETTIKYYLPRTCHVNIQIFNILGQRVRTLVNNFQKSGYREARWNGKDDANNPVSTGIYFYRIKAEKFTATRKMLLLK